MLPRGQRATHARPCVRVLGIAIAALMAGGCYHRNPGPVPYAAAEGPARLQRLDAPSAGDIAWMEVGIRAGSAHDPLGREGIAWLTADLLRHGGTRAMDPGAFDRALADLGAEIDVEVGPEIVRFRARGPANRAAIEALLGAMVSEPRFDEGAFPDAVQRATSALAAHESAPASDLGSDAIRTWVFRGHPYGHLMEGRRGTLETIRAQEVRQFYADRYVRAASAGCVIGQAPAGDALGAALTALPPRLYRDVTPRIVEPVDGRRLLWVESESAEASIHLGRPLELLPGEADEALVALRVLENELAAKVDTKRGLGVVRVALDGSGSDPALTSVQPMVHVSIDTSPDNVPFVLRSVFDTLGEETVGASGADAVRTELMRAHASARESDPCGFALAATLVRTAAADDLDEPQDPAVLAATMRRAWSAEGWKVLVVAPDGQRIAETIREEKPTPPVYAAASTRPSDVDAEDQRMAAMPLSFQRSPREDESVVASDALFR
jgi:hypothetical protein